MWFTTSSLTSSFNRHGWILFINEGQDEHNRKQVQDIHIAFATQSANERECEEIKRLLLGVSNYVFRGNVSQDTSLPHYISVSRIVFVHRNMYRILWDIASSRIKFFVPSWMDYEIIAFPIQSWFTLTTQESILSKETLLVSRNTGHLFVSNKWLPSSVSCKVPQLAAKSFSCWQWRAGIIVALIYFKLSRVVKRRQGLYVSLNMVCGGR